MLSELSKYAALSRAQVVGAEAYDEGRPVALLNGVEFDLSYITKARVLYFLMGTAAVTFIAADVIAEFDKDPNTRTATDWIKQGRKRKAVLGATVAFCVWLPLHLLWDGFPL